MASLNETECKEAAVTVWDVFYLVPSFFNTFSAIGTFLVFWIIYLQFSFRIYYHINAKILIFLNMVSLLTLSLATLLNYGNLFVNAFLAKNNCDFLFLTSNCSLLRRMFLFSMMLTTMTQAALISERAYATCKLGAYEKLGSKVGVILAICSVSFCLITVSCATYTEDSKEMLTNCFAFSSSVSIRDNVYHIFSLQLVIMCGSLVVYLYVADYLKRKVRLQIEGHLADRFQAIENQIVLHQLRPLILASSIIICVYIISSSSGRYLREILSLAHYKQFASVIFIMPHNAFISMTLYFFMFKWSFQDKKKRMEETLTSPITQRQTHIEQLQEQWNEGYKNKEQGAPSPRPINSVPIPEVCAHRNNSGIKNILDV